MNLKLECHLKECYSQEHNMSLVLDNRNCLQQIVTTCVTRYTIYSFNSGYLYNLTYKVVWKEHYDHSVCNSISGNAIYALLCTVIFEIFTCLASECSVAFAIL